MTKMNLLTFSLLIFSTNACFGQLGVNLVDCGNSQGALVKSVAPNSAAQRMLCSKCDNYHHLTPNINVITHVNGNFTPTANSVANAIRNSSGMVSVTVMNLQRGTTNDYRTNIGTGGDSYANNTYANNSYASNNRYQKSRRQSPRNSTRKPYQTTDVMGWLDSLKGPSFDYGTGGSGYGGSVIPNNFDLKLQRNSFNRGYSRNGDHRAANGY